MAILVHLHSIHQALCLAVTVDWCFERFVAHLMPPLPFHLLGLRPIRQKILYQPNLLMHCLISSPAEAVCQFCQFGQSISSEELLENWSDVPLAQPPAGTPSGLSIKNVFMVVIDCCRV